MSYKLTSNYCSTYLTCTNCQIIENIIREGMLAHLEHYNFLGKGQHGFEPKHSTVILLLQCLHDWSNACDT